MAQRTIQYHIHCVCHCCSRVDAIAPSNLKFIGSQLYLNIHSLMKLFAEDIDPFLTNNNEYNLLTKYYAAMKNSAKKYALLLEAPFYL